MNLFICDCSVLYVGAVKPWVSAGEVSKQFESA